ncbi:MAG: ThiF family adenylyltransferase [Bacilli bacterium]|nr:ThiF family adenylyltransferase [Bacilli bacterium]
MTKYIFNDNTKLIFIKNNYILIQNNNKKIKEKLDENFYNMLFKVQKNNYIFSTDLKFFTEEQLKFLYDKSVIKKLSPISEKYINTRYEKYQIYLENIFSDAKKIDYIKNNNQKKILFVGAGGVCTAIIDYLISVGFNSYGIIDFDIVETTNFNRQFKYKETDVGSLKVSKIKSNLNEQYSGLTISTYNKKICSSNDLDYIVGDYNPDFIVCAADTPIFLIQKYIAEVCLKRNIACIFGGVGQTKGVFGPLLYNKKGFNKYLKKINNVLCSLEGVFPCKGSFGITNSLISNYMAKDIIFYMMNKKKKVTSLNKECEIDFDRNVIYEKERY